VIKFFQAGPAAKMAKQNRLLTAFWVSCMLLTGTLNTLTMKIQFTINSVDKNGDDKLFQKPWFGTFNMLSAMFFVLVVEQLFTGCTLFRKQTNQMAPLLEEAAAVKKESKTWGQKVVLVAIPAFFDLLATAFCCIGIMYIPASVWQMLRGSALVFCALLSVCFLKRKMYAFNLIGLALCVVGITTVGLASVLGAQSEGAGSDQGQDIGTTLYGMGLVLLGQVTQAAQVIAEEWLMKDVDLPSVQIIGFEGFWGLLMMIVIVYPVLWVLPGNDGGHVEDPYDTAVMLSNSLPLMACVVTYLFSCGTFNITGIQVTAALSAVHRMMLDASRTMVIWAFGLYVHYCMDPNSKFGESWNSGSYIQLLGFAVLVVGQAIYGEVLKLPGLHYPPVTPAMQASVGSPAAAAYLASPLPREA